MKYRLNYSMGLDQMQVVYEKEKGQIKTCPLCGKSILANLFGLKDFSCQVFYLLTLFINYIFYNIAY
jgi:hypothetical protein